MKIKEKLKSIAIINKTYRKIEFNQKTRGTYDFSNRQSGYDKLCIILAGYKPILWGIVFKRISNFISNDIDVCIVSSGTRSIQLSNIARKNNWSYLCVKRNQVSLAQNIAIKLHPKAKMIFKMDEDMFVTKGTFSSMLDTFKYVSNNTKYVPGVISPIIPVNGYGYVRILKKFNLEEEYQRLFGKFQIVSGPKTGIERNSKVAKFFWGEDNYVPSIDELNKELHYNTREYSICPIRLSIGCIMFTRNFWDRIGMFDVKRGNGMGQDEVKINISCMLESMPIIIDENCVVGHLGFGQQNNVMYNYFLKNKNKFDIL